MKHKLRKIFLSTLLVLTPLAFTSCGDNTPPVEQDGGNTEKPRDEITKRLVVTTEPKTTYLVGEALDLTALKVNIVTTTNGVDDAGVSCTDFITSIKNGYVFQEKDVTKFEPIELIIYTSDNSVASTSISLTVNPQPVEEIKFTPADFFAKMKKVGKYKISNEGQEGLFIPGAHYWYSNSFKGYRSYGWAQNDKKIILYEILEDGTINEKEFFNRGTEVGQYESMYAPEFEEHLTDITLDYYVRGVDFITDADIETYRTKLKQSADNPNIYLLDVKQQSLSDATKEPTYIVRDIVQLMYGESVPRNDFGVSMSIAGKATKLQLEIIDENNLEISIINNNSFSDSWPKLTKITIDETIKIPEIEQFLLGETDQNPNQPMINLAFDSFRKGNFVTAKGDTFTSTYVHRKATNKAVIKPGRDFKYGSTSFVEGSYDVTFEADNSVKEANIVRSQELEFKLFGESLLFTNPTEYMDYLDETTCTLKLTRKINNGTIEYKKYVPALYNLLFDNYGDGAKVIECTNLEFSVTFSDNTYKVIDKINVKFSWFDDAEFTIKNENIDLTNIGTSKVSHVDAFMNLLK